MPSPFPGMDPYLEAPGRWPDFHNRLAGEISGELNLALPEPYYAQIDSRAEIGVVAERGPRPDVVPDIVVARRPQGPAEPGGVAVLDRRRVKPSESFEVAGLLGEIRQYFVEIRDASTGDEVVTLIEILSPSNKRGGRDREAYERKQREVLESDTSLIEIDLHRAGERIVPFPEVAAFIAGRERPPDYLVLVSRSWRRHEGPVCQVFPVGLREWLPCIPVPLRRDEPEVPLDLQFVLQAAYDRGPYRRSIDYSRPPSPPLPADDSAWAEALLRERLGR
jgi:hypothetical protein